MWWKKNYINRRDWLLENIAILDITPVEFILLQIIDYNNSNQQELTMEQLVSQSGIDPDLVNGAIASLNKRHYLALKAVGNQVMFNIDGIFQDREQTQIVNKDIFNIFENEFGRLLSQDDLSTLSRWTQRYSEALIIDALKEAIIMQKLSMQYINGILVNKSKEQTW